MKIPTEPHRIDLVRQNWEYLKKMNVMKANFICNGQNDMPEDDVIISQTDIFQNQLKKYIHTNNEVAILNSFPLFLYEYKDKLK